MSNNTTHHTRTDAFTLGNLAEAEFEIDGFFAQASDEAPAYGVDEAAATYLATGAKIHGGLFTCDVCGAHYKTGVLFTHENGKSFTAGETCAEKLNLGLTSAQWASVRREARRIGAEGLKRKRSRAAARTFIKENPQTLKALRADRTHRILKDLRSSLLKWGQLTPAQSKLASSVAESIADKANAPAAVTSPMFKDGERVTITGLVLNAQTKDTAFGLQYKMLVAVDGPEGRQKLWGSISQQLFDSLEKDLGSIPEGGLIRGFKGRTVTFTAKIQHGKDADFCFYSRPTKSSVLPTS